MIYLRMLNHSSGPKNHPTSALIHIQNSPLGLELMIQNSLRHQEGWDTKTDQVSIVRSPIA